MAVLACGLAVHCMRVRAQCTRKRIFRKAQFSRFCCETLQPRAKRLFQKKNGQKKRANRSESVGDRSKRANRFGFRTVRFLLETGGNSWKKQKLDGSGGFKTKSSVFGFGPGFRAMKKVKRCVAGGFDCVESPLIMVKSRRYNGQEF